MTENVEGLNPSEEEQPPGEPAPVSKTEEEQLSQPDSQDVVSREEFNRAVNELRGLQGEQDKLKHQFSTQFERTARDIGVELTDEQKLELRLRNLEATSPVQPPASSGEEQASEDSAEVAPEVQELIDQASAKAVSEALKIAPTGASAVAPGGGTTPSQISIEEAAEELLELQTKPRSTWTVKESTRAAEIMKRYDEEVDK